MLDEILDMFGRKRRAGGAKPGGIGGMLSRVQGAMEGDDDDRHRPSHGRAHRDDDHDDVFDRDDDRPDHRGRRREREGFDLGDD